MSGDQIPSLPGKKRRQMPGVCPGVGGEMLKLRFDWYIIYIIVYINSGTRRSNSPQFSRLLKTFNHGLNHSKIHTARQFCDFVSSFSFSAIYFLKRDFSNYSENLFNGEPFIVFYTESVMLGPRFIPESVFYTQSVMLSPRFIPKSVFYIQSVVRSLCFILTGLSSDLFQNNAFSEGYLLPCQLE